MRKLVLVAALSALALIWDVGLASAGHHHGGCGCGGGSSCGSCGYSGCGSCGYGGSCGYSSCGYSSCGYSSCGYSSCGYSSCGYGGSCGYSSSGSCGSYGYGSGGSGATCSSGGCCAYADSGVPYTAVAAAPSDARTATLIVNLPVDATLKVDDYATTSTSAERAFTTPALKAGQDYHYTLTAAVNHDGKVESVSRDVTVRGGETTRIHLEVPVATVAAR